MRAEDLLFDPVLTEVMDTTLRIKIGDQFFKITKEGTFAAPADKIDLIAGVIDEIRERNSRTKAGGEAIEKREENEMAERFGDVVFMPSFSGSVKTNDSYLDDSDDFGDLYLVKSNESGLHDGYNVETHKWKNNSTWQKFWDEIRGKDVKQSNYFSKTRRVRLEVFDVNYLFYSSAGIRVKMQKRKSFLFVKYWRKMEAEKLTIGFNNVSGVLNLKNSRSFSAIIPTGSTAWDKFTGTINKISSEFIYGQYHKMDIIKDWVEDIYMFLPEVKLAGKVYPNRAIMNKLYEAPARSVCSFLKKQAGKYIYKPIKKQIQPKDPRLVYFVWGNTSQSFDKERLHVMGVKEYSHRSEKVIRFARSFGFTLSNFNVKGFTPADFDIKAIDVFGAAYYHGQWKGVRMVKEEKK